MQKTGIFIGRLNPPHIGHIKVIKTSLKNNSLTIIFLGSSNMIDDKNPFSYEERNIFLEKIFKKKISNGKLIIDYIEDFPSDEVWCEKLGEKIKKYLKRDESKVTFYAGDFKNDSAVIAIKNNLKSLNLQNIDFFEVYRKNILLPNGEEISSTNLRKHLKERDFSLAKKLIYPGMKNLIVNKWKEKFPL